MATIDNIITHTGLVGGGAPMGRCNVGKRPADKRIYDCRIPMDRSDSAYDKGGAYWGHGAAVRVTYTKDLSYIRFYREGTNPDD